MQNKKERNGSFLWPRSRSIQSPLLPKLCVSAWLVFTLFVSAAGYGLTEAASQSQSPISSIRQIRHLTSDALSRSPQVHVRGIVTYYDSVGPNLFVQNGSGGIWVDLRGTSA